MCKEFNPDAFSFENFKNSHKGKKVSSRSTDTTQSYVLVGSGGFDKKGNPRKSLKLVLGSDLAESITKKFGDHVDFGFEKTGNIYLREGDMRKLSSNQADRLTVSLDTYAEEYIQIMGKFNRIYLEPVFGTSVVGFKPTGERD